MNEEVEDIPLVEGDEDVPEIVLNPVEVESEFQSDDLLSEPKNLPIESFEPDLNDDKGLGGPCG